MISPGPVSAVHAADGRLGFGVPGYAHPMLAPTEWAEVSRPGVPLHWVVLNVDGGPGDRPDPYWHAVAHQLRTGRENPPALLGHLDLGRGARPLSALLADACRYRDWYRVDGFYLGDCPTQRVWLGEVKALAEAVRALYEDHVRLVLGHGRHPDPGYLDVGDQLVTFRGPWSEYRWSQVARWTADHLPERFCHLVHGVPPTHLSEALRVARWQGAGTVYLTDRTAWDGADPWESLPGYWDELVSMVGTGVSE
ncbi:spherulation-specific family 4 protein [Streptomyces sp. NPDC005438]|uniref:spherulation-specific family 4 protein n=1 Tax=Streptomyces sp. NPDC005438 TaxID=3156880 RepID=UPI0033BB8C96